MIFYCQRGELPPKKHTTFYKENGKDLYREELFSCGGFQGVYSTRYHLYEPTRVQHVQPLEFSPIQNVAKSDLIPSHCRTKSIFKQGNLLNSRQRLLFNADVEVSLLGLNGNSPFVFRNADAHELYFVHEGNGRFESEYGSLDLIDKDYLIIPKGINYQIFPNSGECLKLLLIESKREFQIPKNFKNSVGQLLEHAPYSERDFVLPKFEPPAEKTENCKVVIKKTGTYFEYTLDHHPFDLIGWDGYHYPFKFNMDHYQPIAGRMHQPPPVHTVFENEAFMITNFVPRMVDFDQNAVPAPYFHSNIDCDEMLYYIKGDFLSRNGIEEGSITLHPAGIPHGPQPGKIEASLGKREVEEYALMLDTFSPLKRTEIYEKGCDENYLYSWLPK